MIDILDELQEIEGYVKLVMKSGNIVFGRPSCIVYDEDEDGYETLKKIRFVPWPELYANYYSVDDIKSFETIEEKDLPTYK